MIRKTAQVITPTFRFFSTSLFAFSMLCCTRCLKNLPTAGADPHQMFRTERHPRARQHDHLIGDENGHALVVARVLCPLLLLASLRIASLPLVALTVLLSVSVLFFNISNRERSSNIPRALRLRRRTTVKTASGRQSRGGGGQRP